MFRVRRNKKALSADEILFNRLAKVPKTKAKHDSIRSQCLRLWRSYGSKYYRKRDALRRGNGELVKCVSCGKVDHWRNFDAGHFIPRSYLNAFFAENNIHNQCYSCNQMKSGNILAYEDFIEATYGSAELKRLKALRFTASSVTVQDLERLRVVFRNALKEWKVIP